VLSKKQMPEHVRKGGKDKNKSLGKF